MKAGRSPSVLAELRALIPQRPLYYSEALHLAELQANRLLDMFVVTEAPVPSEIITGLPRIKVEVHPGLPVPGCSRWADGRWIVQLAGEDHPRRRRYTLAHELKHILDHPYRHFIYSGFRDDVRDEQVERVADHFAAALLMPKRIVIRAFTAGIQDIHELARLFKVSPAAMRVRLHRLALLEFHSETEAQISRSAVPDRAIGGS